MTTRREAIDKEIAEARAKIARLEHEKENLPRTAIVDATFIEELRDRTLHVKVEQGVGLPDEIRVVWPLNPTTGARYVRA